MTLVYLSLAWMAGILLAARLPGVSPALWLVPAGWGLAGRYAGRHRRLTRVLAGCVIFLALGALRYGLAQPHFDESDLATYNDSGFGTLEGVVIDSPDVRDSYVNLRVRAETLELDGEAARSAGGVVLVRAPLFGDYHYGSRVRVRGEVLTPPEFEDFSYRDYLARQGVYSYVERAEVDILPGRGGNPARRLMADFRVKAQEHITRLLPDPQASLLSGILLGIESGIDREVGADFSATGATHVIAISGSNLAVLAGIVRSLTRRWLKPRPSALLTTGIILTYSLFVGGDPAVMRAFFMAAVAISGEELFRNSFAPASLSFTALLMSLLNPLVLWDVSFLLSFLSTWGLVLYADPIASAMERGLARLISAQRAKQIVATLTEAFIVTLAAQITTTPITVLFFGRLPVVSLPVNLLIIPAQTPLMITGGLAVIASFIIWPLGQLLAWIDWLFLTYTVAVVRFFAALPFASVQWNVSPRAVWAFYVALFGGTALVAQERHLLQNWWAGLKNAFSVKATATAGLVAVVLLGAFNFSLPDGRLHVWYLSVPGGQATLIQTPSGRHILVDGGQSGQALSARMGEVMPFWKRHIDVLVISQPIEHHAGGLPRMLDRYSVGQVITNGQSGDGETLAALWAALDDQNTQVNIAQTGMAIEIGDGVTLTIVQTQTPDLLEPQEPGEPVALRLVYDDASFLLTGDLSPDTATDLSAGPYGLPATVLQIPAHGDAEVNTEAFLNATLHQLAVVPVDAGSRFAQPDPETLDMLSASDAILYRTDVDGTVHVATDGHMLWLWPSEPGD